MMLSGEDRSVPMRIAGAVRELDGVSGCTRDRCLNRAGHSCRCARGRVGPRRGITGGPQADARDPRQGPGPTGIRSVAYYDGSVSLVVRDRQVGLLFTLLDPALQSNFGQVLQSLEGTTDASTNASSDTAGFRRRRDDPRVLSDGRVHATRQHRHFTEGSTRSSLVWA
jgi:hypothetical protein